MADGPEGYVSGLIWESPHQIVPDDAILLNVKVVGPVEGLPFAVAANVKVGPDGLQGKQINIAPENWNSCIGLGRMQGYVAVRREAMQVGEREEIVVFQAIDYLPAPEDRSSGWKRERNWFIPGRVAPKLGLPSAE